MRFYHPSITSLVTTSALLVAALLLDPETAVAQQPRSTYCEPGQAPLFRWGLATLKEQLGPVMGEPLECEHGSPATGGSVQSTSTGVAYYRQSTNTAGFTDGVTDWQLSPTGVNALPVSHARQAGRVRELPLGLRDPLRCTQLGVADKQQDLAAGAVIGGHVPFGDGPQFSMGTDGLVFGWSDRRQYTARIAVSYGNSKECIRGYRGVPIPPNAFP